jgi:NAD(P)H-dependent flavin oxidoreductase YrpB (nitropropane dioxygenase family)
MKSPLCEQLGIEYPIFGFTPSPAVAAAITRAGGMGVLGLIRYTDMDEMAKALDWMDANVDGKPYGLDIVMPMKYVGGDQTDQLHDMISDKHRSFVEDVLTRFNVPKLPEDEESPTGILGWMHTHARAQVDLALQHPVKLLANALGSPPKDVIDQAHEKGVLVAALAGKAKHALSHKAAGVDIIVAQGHEAGGHCGEVTTMVLVPEIVRAVGDVPVLAAGGIGTGEQIAASFALGARGVWMGSAWLTAEEYKEEPPTETGYSVVKHKLLDATSSDTVRSKVISGKPARMLKTPWTEAWVAEDSPGTLPMPLQGLLVGEAEARIRRVQSKELLGTPVGQIVGLMNDVQPVAKTIERLIREFEEAVARVRESG